MEKTKRMKKKRKKSTTERENANEHQLTWNDEMEVSTARAELSPALSRKDLFAPFSLSLSSETLEKCRARKNKRAIHTNGNIYNKKKNSSEIKTMPYIQQSVKH